jgi:hypothetical protein
VPAAPISAIAATELNNLFIVLPLLEKFVAP